MRNKTMTIFRVTALVMALVLLASCTGQIQDSAPSPESPTLAPPSATSMPSATPTPSHTPLPPTSTQTATLAPSDTSTPLPSPTISPTATMEPSPTQTETQERLPTPENLIRMYFILLETGGPVACGDSIIGVSFGVEQTGDIAADAMLALNTMFAYRDENVFGTYNPLARSSLKATDVEFDPDDGLITVQLTGNYTRTDDKCDKLRVREQVWATARQFKGVRATNIFLNRIPFGDLLKTGR